jgi:hypothetical protein
MNDVIKLTHEDIVQMELALQKTGESGRRYGRLLAALLSAIPWVGSAIGAGAALHAEIDQGKINELHKQWLEEHRRRLHDLAGHLEKLFGRLDSIYESARTRVESQEYLNIVRRAFKSWDNAESDEKKGYIANLIVNSASTKIAADDLIRLFNDWIDLYHEAHFKVIREVYTNPGSTRGDIWDNIAGSRPREDSAEADLYRMLIRDLSTGGVIRQARQTTMDGRFLKRKPHRTGSPSTVMDSAFEDTKGYELTALGEQFVHYTMSETTTKIA